MKISPLGWEVAELLGELFYGIYHLDHKALKRTDWSNNSFIEFSLGWQCLATFDIDGLTRLVFLAHHRGIRIEVQGSKANYLKLLFHKRKRKGNIYQRHPTLAEAVAKFRIDVTMPEYLEK
jgi:hypothetical protein